MSDFNSNLPVGITGLNLSSVPTFPIDADSAGNMNVRDVSAGPVTNGTAALFSSLIGGQYNSALPTLTTAQQSAIQLDSSARVIISPLTNTSIIKSQLQDNVGDGITSTPINSKQRLDVNTSSEGTDGAVAPFQSIQIGGKDTNGNLQSVSVDTTGAIYVTERLPLTGSPPVDASVGISSGTIIAANTSRRGLVLTNTSTGIISLNINGGTAILRAGITLYPGGHWEMDAYTFTTAAINGISSVAASNVAIQELT